MRTFLIFLTGLLMSLAAPGAERAGYDSRGRFIALLSDAGEIELYSNFVAVLHSGRRVSLMERRVSGGPRSQGQERSWFGAYALPDGGRVRLEWQTQDEASALRFTAKATPEGSAVAAIELILDLSREAFVGGSVTPEAGPPVSFPSRKPAGAALYSGQTTALRFQDSTGNIVLSIGFGEARPVSVMDRWDLLGVSHTMPNMPLDEGGQAGTMYYNRTRRSYQIRIPFHVASSPGEPARSLSATLALVNNTKMPPARLTVDTSRPRYLFDGFGGNFCWNNERGNRNVEVIQAYLLKNLKHGWSRTEMKIQQWDEQRENPGPQLRLDFETMQQLQKMGVPYVISIWRLPERFNADPATEPAGARGRAVDPAKWDELARLLVDYLLYAKKEYGVEPDMFSFNEGNLGVNVRLTPEEHTLQIKVLGAAFRKAGLKTRMLLGDAVPARDSHVFALDAAADPEALRYIAGVAFHSWGGATPHQYAAWGDLAEWLNVPLLVTELGVDSAAYETNAWDTYHYGLREVQFTQEMLIYARPHGTQFWQYTDDYALARLRPDGKVEPTARFWLMKHFTDLTPLKSEALATTSDQDNVLMTAFRKGSIHAIHILNRGGQREATCAGLPDGEWVVTESTEAMQYQQQKRATATNGTLRLNLPARSLVTLTSSGGRAATD